MPTDGPVTEVQSSTVTAAPGPVRLRPQAAAARRVGVRDRHPLPRGHEGPPDHDQRRAAVPQRGGAARLAARRRRSSPTARSATRSAGTSPSRCRWPTHRRVRRPRGLAALARRRDPAARPDRRRTASGASPRSPTPWSSPSRGSRTPTAASRSTSSTRPTQILVPEPVYVPKGDQVASSLVRGLLPLGGHRPAASSAPTSREGFTLGLSVPITSPASPRSPSTATPRRSTRTTSQLMLTQLIWTLRQDPRSARSGSPSATASSALPGGATQVDLDVGERLRPHRGAGHRRPLRAPSTAASCAAPPASLLATPGPWAPSGSASARSGVNLDGHPGRRRRRRRQRVLVAPRRRADGPAVPGGQRGPRPAAARPGTSPTGCGWSTAPAAGARVLVVDGDRARAVGSRASPAATSSRSWSPATAAAWWRSCRRATGPGRRRPDPPRRRAGGCSAPPGPGRSPASPTRPRQVRDIGWRIADRGLGAHRHHRGPLPGAHRLGRRRAGRARASTGSGRRAGRVRAPGRLPGRRQPRCYAVGARGRHRRDRPGAAARRAARGLTSLTYVG